jgi:hypothetical protein
MAGGILGGVLPLAVLEVLRLHENAGAVCAGPLTVGLRIVYAYHHRMGGLPGPRRAAIVAHVADDDRTVSAAELRAVVLADPNTLEKPEGGTQPVDRFSYVRVYEDGDDRGLGDGAVGLQT